MTAAPIKLLHYDPTGVLLADTGITREELIALYPRLAEVQHEVAAEAPSRPQEAGVLQLPERLLAEYGARREASTLHRLLRTAGRLREQVDRVVVLAGGGPHWAVRALFEACCEPHFNELSRADRGSRPRMYFAGDHLDNDALQGLLHLLGGGRRASTLDDRWALVVIDNGPGAVATAVAFRHCLAALRSACDGDHRRVADLVVPVVAPNGPLAALTADLGCLDIYDAPAGKGAGVVLGHDVNTMESGLPENDSRPPPGDNQKLFRPPLLQYSGLSPAVLLPAAILGRDVISLLCGATALNRHFRASPPAENIVLQYAGVSHLAATRRGLTGRVLAAWAQALKGVGRWYQHLLADSWDAPDPSPAAPTTVATWERPVRGRPPAAGRCDQLVTNLIVDQWRCDPLPVEPGSRLGDPPDDHRPGTLPELTAQAVREASAAHRRAGRPCADLRLPHLDEATLGQLFQMLLLATSVEHRLSTGGNMSK